jgi:GDP-L-fucose synthase
MAFENILITGGSGLVGSCINFGRKPSHNELDVMDYNALKNYVIKNNITEIVHCAAKVGGVAGNKNNMLEYFSDNLTMNANIIRCCKEMNIQKSIFILSTCVFPKDSNNPLTEDMLHEGEPHETNYGYAYSKRMLEVASRCLPNSICLIPCNLYGIGDNYNLENGHVIPSLIHKCYLAKQNNTDLNIWGFGKAEREFLFANDFGRIIEQMFINSDVYPKSMIVSPDNCVTIKEIAIMIADIMGYTGNIVFDTSKPEGILKKNTSNYTFKKYFPMFKFTELRTGLEQSISWFSNNYNKVRK